jgi:uncharacterized protein
VDMTNVEVFKSENSKSEFIEYVETCMASYKCPTHDMNHVLRVSNIAVSIAKCDPCLAPDSRRMRLVEMAALCHDLCDQKLVPKEELALADERLCAMLKKHTILTDEEIDSIIYIAKSVGYKNLINPKFSYSNSYDRCHKEYKCVQDADLLDAIGAIGIGRCFAFSGKRNKNLFACSVSINDHVDADAYAFNNSSSSDKKRKVSDISLGDEKVTKVNRRDSATDHFFEKLFRIRNLLQTPKGCELGRSRQITMLNFFRDIVNEIPDSSDRSLLMTNLDVITKEYSVLSEDRSINKETIKIE